MNDVRIVTLLVSWQLCSALNINKKSVDRDLDVYRNLLSKLVQAKELLKEYVARYKQVPVTQISHLVHTITQCIIIIWNLDKSFTARLNLILFLTIEWRLALHRGRYSKRCILWL